MHRAGGYLKRHRFSRALQGLALLAAIVLASSMTTVAVAPADSPPLLCAGEPATVVGTAGPDSLTGSPGADVVVGRGGPDRIVTGGGDDLICAGAGADTVRPGDGADEVRGQEDSDQLRGGRGDDLLNGGRGLDNCQGGAGTDRLNSCERIGEGDREPQVTFTPNAAGGAASAPVTPAAEVKELTEIASVPPLTPAFDPAVSDYTVECDGSPLKVLGKAVPGETVAIDGQAAQTGSFATTVALEENQEFQFSVGDSAAARDYHVRCLPADFPIWNYERLRSPSHPFYVVTPTLSLSGGAAPYLVIFDDRGVPVWWMSDAPAPPSDGKVLANGNIVWWGSPPGGDAYEIRDLNGTLLQAVRPVTGRTDSHELQVEPNGDYLVTSYVPREHVDLTTFGGAVDATVIDAEIEEVTPTGELVWEWSTQGHIGLAETGRWWPTALKAAGGADIVHMNAVEPVGDDAVLISLRHTDAVYKIDKATGDVIWKLGGTWTPQSLTVSKDPEGAYPFGGQHDVRLLPDGTITVYDNNTNLPDPPRSVRYEINEASKTATMVEELTDPKVPSSICCGSSRHSPDGSWLMSWGGNSLVTEFDGAGQRTFQLGFGGAAFSYRATSVPAGALTAEALRAGMDSMHPRP